MSYGAMLSDITHLARNNHKKAEAFWGIVGFPQTKKLVFDCCRSFGEKNEKKF